ncbi:MAG: DNA polymerase III subunit gamma/tau [Chloroflexota bacterium]
MTQALYRKWRPHQWDEVVGQGHIVQTLTNAVRAGRVGHAYLFAGPRGTGKTTIARIIAKAVNCLHEDPAQRPCNKCDHCVAVNENRFLDLIEIDAASNTSVDDVRDLRDKINFAPSQGKYKIYIIDEVHMLSTAAFNALLKTLEEPPPHAIFVLATTEIHKIPATVLSRCQRHEFRRVPVDEIVAQLKRIARDEKIKADEDALTLIARQSAGGMRDAISLLDQLSSTGQKIDLALTQTVLGTATSQTVLDLVASIADQQPAPAMDAIHRALDSGADPRSLARQIVDYLRGLLLVQMGNADQVEAAKEVKSTMTAHAKAFSTHEVLRMMKVFNAAAADTRGGWQPSLGLELALAEALEAPQPVTSAAPAPPPPAPGKTSPAPKPAPPMEAAPAASAASQPEPSASTPPLVSNAQVIQAWKQVQAHVKGHSVNLAALLNSVKSIDVQGSTLVLGLASAVLVEKMDKPDQIEATRQALRDLLGVDLAIKCVVTTARGQLPPDINPDGMVATAIQNGGEIVDVQE